MSHFVIQGFLRENASIQHGMSDKRYWEGFLRCGQPAEPEILLDDEKSEWEGFNAVVVLFSF